MRLSRSTGGVDLVEIEESPTLMYNLTIAEVHTFVVGQGEWFVHNASMT